MKVSNLKPSESNDTLSMLSLVVGHYKYTGITDGMKKDRDSAICIGK